MQQNEDLMHYQEMTIAAGEKKKILRAGDFFRVVFSNGPLELYLNGQAAGPVEDNGGYNGQMSGRGFSYIELKNNNATAVTCGVFVGSGELFNNNIAIGGTVQIENALGDLLDVEDAAAQAILTAMDTKIAAHSAETTAVKGEINQLRTEQSYFQQNLLAQLKAQADMTDCTIFAHANANVTISAGTNVNGILIPFLSYSNYGSLHGGLKIDGKIITPRNSATASSLTGTIDNIKTPAGVEVQFYSDSAYCFVSGAYKVL